MKRLTQADEARISWFFSAGETAFFRSTAGSMLARQERYAYYSTRDEKGEHLRILNTMPQCEDCNGTGRGNHGPCDECIGTGRSLLTVRPQTPKREEGGYTANDGALRRYAEVYSMLEAVGRQEQLLVRVAEALYGDRGVKWASEAQGGPPNDPEDPDEWEEWVQRRGWGPGRMAAVYPLTKSGASFVKREKARTPHSLTLSSDELVRILVLAKERDPTNHENTRLLSRMADEADILFLRLAREWQRARQMKHRERLWLADFADGEMFGGRLLVVRRADMFTTRRISKRELYLLSREVSHREERIEEVIAQKRRDDIMAAALAAT